MPGFFEKLNTWVVRMSKKDEAKPSSGKLFYGLLVMMFVIGALSPVGYLAAFLLPIIMLIDKSQIDMSKRVRASASVFAIVALGPFLLILPFASSKLVSEEKFMWGDLTSQYLDEDMSKILEFIEAKNVTVAELEDMPLGFNGTTFFMAASVNAALKLSVDTPDNVSASDIFPLMDMMKAERVFIVLAKDIQAFNVTPSAEDEEVRIRSTLAVNCMMNADGSVLRASTVLAGQALNALDHPKMAPLVEACAKAAKLPADKAV